MSGQDQRIPKSKRPARLLRFVLLEIVILLALFGSYRLYIAMKADDTKGTNEQQQQTENEKPVKDGQPNDAKEE